MLQLKNSIDFDLEAMVKGINNYNHFAIRRNCFATGVEARPT